GFISYTLHLCSLHLSTLFLVILHPPPLSTLFPYTTLFRSIPCSDVSPNQTARELRSSESPNSRSWCRCMTDPRTVRIRLPSVSRSEEHTSELQSQSNLVCRLLLEKKKIKHRPRSPARLPDT